MQKYWSKFVKVYDTYSFKALIPIFVILVAALSTHVVKDLDFYFIWENGKKILTEGFPYTDWMSMHDSLHIVVQQWIVAVMVYFFDNTFGFYSIKTIFVIAYFIYFISVFIVCSKLTNKNYLVAMLTVSLLAVSEISLFNTIRPQCFSLFFVTAVILINEFYIRRDNTKFLFLLPLVSLLHANFHSTFWIIGIGISFLYLIFNCLNKKTINWKHILIFICTVLIGLINPYGYEALLHPFYTIGYPLYKYISELQNLDLAAIIFFILIPWIITTALIIFRIRRKQELRSIIPALIIYYVSLIGAIVSARLLMYNIATWVILTCLLCIFPKTHPQKDLIENEKNKIEALVLIGFTIIAAIIWGVPRYASISDIEDNECKNFTEMSEYFNTQEDIENKTFIATNISEGEYFYHYNHMHPYIDGRLETYIKSLNKKDDILNEFFYYYRLQPEEFNDLLEKYKINYIMVASNEDIWNEAIDNNSNYKLDATFNEQGTDTIMHSKTLGYRIYKRV